MSNNLNDLVAVRISISAPAPDSASFDSMLIVGLPPINQPAKPLPDVGIYSNIAEVGDAGFIIEGTNADPVGIAARIAFTQNPRPVRVFIATMQEGEETALELPHETLQRALNTPGWYAVCPAGIHEDEFERIAEWTERNEKIFAYTFLQKTDPVPNIYWRSHGWCGLINDDDEPASMTPESAYLHVAITAKVLGYPAGSETWAYKQLAGIQPTRASRTLTRTLIDNNSNFYGRNAGRNISMNGKTRGGEWIDIIRGRDWLQSDIQLRLFNLLLAHPKIPYTNHGIALVENEITASLTLAVERGVVAEDEFDEENNLIPGFTVNVPNVATISTEERAGRALTGITFSARLLGAIHAVSVSGSLTY